MFLEPVHVGRPNVGDRAAFFEKVEGLLTRNWLTNNGPLVKEFERLIAQRLGVRHCVAMCNGTVALEIAIRAMELKGEVIVPSWTFVATAHALSWQGITPVFADIDPDTHNISPLAVRRMLTPRTSGIVGVHLWGRAAPVEELQDIASEHNLGLLFDAAHAFGCTHRGQSIGGFGRCEVLSFHATKVLNTMEGGAVVTNDNDLAEKMRLMRNFGFQGYDNVIHPGTNGKMTEICAAMGLVNLASLDDFISGNVAAYSRYSEALADIPGVRLLKYDPAERNSHQYVVIEIGKDFPGSRDEVVDALHGLNILARKYFWPGSHAMQPYKELYPHAGLLLSQTINVAEKVVILPSGPSLPQGCVEVVADTLKSFIR